MTQRPTGPPWAALVNPLQAASKNNFRLLEQISDLGPTLKRAAEALAQALEGDAQAGMRAYAEQLVNFEDGSRSEKARLVALGLRICATAGPQAKPRQKRESLKDVSRDLDAPLTVLKGVGPAVARRLAGRGLHSVEDLLYFLPLEYIDRRNQVPLQNLHEGERVTTRGMVVKVNQRRARGRKMLEVGMAPGPEGPATLSCVWFRAYPGLAERFECGKEILVHGTIQRYKRTLQMVHPDVLESPDGQETFGIRRRYPDVEGVAAGLLERICTEACQSFADLIQDGVPDAIARRLDLPSQTEALNTLHLMQREPDDQDLAYLQRGTHPAHRRLVFDELFSLQLAVALRRKAWGQRRAHSCKLTVDDRKRVADLFPFTLTQAQKRVVAEILRDMERGSPMHRLLQGDVGSGKTVVAFIAAWAAMAGGLQAAIMAPTEILARQHFQLMEPWVQNLGYRAALVTAATPKAARASLLALTDAGEIHLLVGTHALLSPRVQLPNLGLAVVDEQHRFGVLQRVRLRERPPDEPLPHLLLMTATPIPRSLALAVYGDLDLSVLDEKPPGRKPSQTRVFLGKRRQRAAYELVREQLSRSQQVFVVCPLVEESEKLQVADAVSTSQRLAELFPECRVGLVHGRMSSRDRARVMDAFRGRELDLLVSTTVIEVGVDIPHANVMVVEHADRFGLAQLHQLRGRVGRGEEDSYCLLLSNTDPSSPAGQRLDTMASTDDGFEIAEADLKLRGPGEVFGTRQSGLPRLRFANLMEHMKLLSLAQKEADALVRKDPELSEPGHRQAREVMLRRWESIALVGEEAG